MKEFLMDMFRQVFGVQKPRTGKIILTRYTYQKMREYQLDTDTLEDTFRNGEEVEKGKILRKYANYSVRIYYKLEETQLHKNINSENRYVIITCWKGGEL
jgi:hypothetical protein